MPKSRAERDRGRGETPSKRALRGAQKTGRQDPERGVTSRARKRRQGLEDVPDPRYGGRPGEEKSKWRPPAELMTRSKSGSRRRSISQNGLGPFGGRRNAPCLKKSPETSGARVGSSRRSGIRGTSPSQAISTHRITSIMIRAIRARVRKVFDRKCHYIGMRSRTFS